MIFDPIQQIKSFIACFLFFGTSAAFADLIEVAGLGRVNQTSEWNGGQFPAGNAIDGNSSTFSHTDTTTPNNRWEVLLDQEYEVARIEVEMRGDCCAGRMTGTIVRGFDGTESAVFSAELSDPGIGGTVIFEVPMGLKMERVRVGFEDGGTNPRASTTMIHLGEVRVFAQREALVAIESFAASPGEVSAGQEVSLNWTTIGADEVRLFPGGQLLAGAGSIVVNPSESVVYEIEASNSRGSARSVLGVLVDGAALPFQVTEVVASNGGSLVRSDGSTPDWIELWNPNPFELDLSGYGLSDDESEVRKFVFPSKVVPAGGYLVVDAADQSVDEVLATGFNLGRDAGEILILSGPDLQVLETLVFPKQYVDVSYGSFRVEEFRYFVEPSPGEANVGETVRGFVRDLQFSVKRGFYEVPQLLEITNLTPESVIYVTTDGSEPGPRNPAATPYDGAITISETTVLRAAAFRDGWEPTDVDTQTYLFADQVGGQSPSPGNFPQQWVPTLNGVQAPVSAFSHFEMNAGVLSTLPLLDLAGEDFELKEALTSIPSISLALDAGVLFDPANGLHVNARQRGRAWERNVSFEVIDPVRGSDVQTNCGLRMHGGWNRFPEMLKKSFRIYFRSEYGDSKLEYPMFPGSEVEEFDRLILRSGNGKAWASPWRALSGAGNSLERVTYLRDQIVRDFQRATGNYAIPGTFMHLYINGHYWGLYNPVERPTEHFGAARYGGDDDEYEVIKWIRGVGHQVSAGDDVAWNRLIGLVRGNVLNAATYDAIQDLLDLENFADYIIVNHFAGNRDWIDNNVYAMRLGLPGEPFRFYCWDSEESFLSLGTDISDRNVSDTCTEIHMALRRHPEYRQLFADRVYRHFFNEGALTPERTGKVLESHVDLIDQAIVGESARWGGLLRPGNPYDRNDWLDEVANLQGNYLSRRTGIALGQFKNDGLYPGVSPPVFLPQRGGQVPAGTPVILESDSGGTIYYTLDGSDPRLAGGGVSGSALEFLEGVEEEEVIALGSAWKYLDDGSDLGASDVVPGHPGYGALNWKHGEFDDAGWGRGAAPLGYGRILGTTLNTTVSYGDDPAMRYRTTYFRKSFEVPNAARFSSLDLRALRDDGVVIYLNGEEVMRSGFSAGSSVVTAETLAAEQSSSSESTLFEAPVPLGLLQDGQNVITAEIHQASDYSSDLGFDLQLIGKAPGPGERVDILGGTLIKSRVLKAGTWSALNEALFLAGDRAQDLYISEMMYHPEEGGAEFLELSNRGRVRHPLGDLKIRGGIQFDFSAGSVTSLDPGDRLVLVRNAGVFALVYPDTSVAGDYGGGLGNGSDSFSLEDLEGNVLWTMAYRDKAPWPSGTDGAGRSFIYVGGKSNEAGSWRPSVDIGGNPGTSDRVPYPDDGSLLAYAIERQGFILEDSTTALFMVVLKAGADEVLAIPERSSDMESWTGDGLTLWAQDPIGNGLVRKTWQMGRADAERLFLRMRLRRP
ncbi:MAG: CotH kinase family protein [Akkermansiaceae bacterium]|nr:CotH kinase family protein [Akkermansiaceae bacterium]